MQPPARARPRSQNPFIFGPTRCVLRYSSMQQSTPSPVEPPLSPLIDQEPEVQESAWVTEDRPPTPPPKDWPSKGGRRSRYIPLGPFVSRAREAHRRSRYITIDEFVTRAREAEVYARESSEVNAQDHKQQVLKRCKSWCVNEGRNSLVMRSCVPSTAIRAAVRRATVSWTAPSFHELKRRWMHDMEASSMGSLPSRRSTSAALRANMRPTAPIHIPRRQHGQLPDPESLTDQVFAELRAAIDASVKSFRATRNAEKSAVNKRLSEDSDAEAEVRTEKERTMMQIRDKMEDLEQMLERERVREGIVAQYLEGRRSWGEECDLNF